MIYPKTRSRFAELQNFGTERTRTLEVPLRNGAHYHLAMKKFEDFLLQIRFLFQMTSSLADSGVKFE